MLGRIAAQTAKQVIFQKVREAERDNVYAEYEFTIHDENRTGVRATCADCHLPAAFPAKYVAKAANGWSHSKGSPAPAVARSTSSVSPGSVASRASDRCMVCGSPSKIRPQPAANSVSPQNSRGVSPPWKYAM